MDNNCRHRATSKTPTALGIGVASTTVQAGSQLQVANVSAPISEPLVLNGQGPDNNGALTNVAGNNTWAGSVTLDSDTWFGVTSGVLTMTGSISDLGAGHSITKVGPGQMILTVADSYHGSTTVTLGTLTIENPNALGVSDGTAATETVVQTNINLGSGSLQLDDPTGVGFTVSNVMLVLNASGFNLNPALPGNGALENVNGNNVWTGPVFLGTTNNSPPIAIGVDAEEHKTRRLL